MVGRRIKREIESERKKEGDIEQGIYSGMGRLEKEVKGEWRGWEEGYVRHTF